MVFDATFNNISVISWWSVLLVKETAVPVSKEVNTIVLLSLYKEFVLSLCYLYLFTNTDV